MSGGGARSGMGTCGGADPTGVTIRLAVNLGRLSFPCGYNVHRNSGIDLARISGSVFGKSKAVAATSVSARIMRFHALYTTPWHGKGTTP